LLIVGPVTSRSTTTRALDVGNGNPSVEQQGRNFRSN
jgi:hypothetical protein